MLKKDKGVTLLMLVITVVVMMILTGVSLTSGTYNIKQMRAGRIISNMKLVKMKVHTIAEENNFNGTQLKGQGPKKIAEIVEMSETEKQKLAEKYGENAENIDHWDWYQWDATQLANQGLDANMLPNSEAYFYVNYNHEEVLYTMGTSFDNNTSYYTLTGLEYILAND